MSLFRVNDTSGAYIASILIVRITSVWQNKCTWQENIELFSENRDCKNIFLAFFYTFLLLCNFNVKICAPNILTGCTHVLPWSVSSATSLTDITCNYKLRANRRLLMSIFQITEYVIKWIIQLIVVQSDWSMWRKIKNRHLCALSLSLSVDNNSLLCARQQQWQSAKLLRTLRKTSIWSEK